MPVPDFTPYEGLLPSESDPATFPARAEALMAWFTQTGAPQLKALAQFLDGLVDDEATVLNALEALETSLGGLAYQDVLNEPDFASGSEIRPPSQSSVGAYVNGMSLMFPHFVGAYAGSSVNRSGGTETTVPFDTVLQHDATRLPGISLTAGDLLGVPAGDYYIEWVIRMLRNSGSNGTSFNTALVNADTGVDLVVAEAGNMANYNSSESFGKGVFTLAASTDLKIVTEVGPYSADLLGPVGTGSRSGYRQIMRLWKIT